MGRSVKGKTAIVTGAGSGINLEFARTLLNNGCNVVIGDLSLRPEAQKVVDQYSGTKSVARAVFCKTDVASWSDLHNLFKSTEEEFGTFDIVCPGAGIFEPTWSGFWAPPGSEHSKDSTSSNGYISLDVNLVHPIRATQLAFSHFLASKPPASKDNLKVVVLIASIAAELGFAPVPLYCAAKWGVRGFIYSMGEFEETRHIRVAGVAPAIVRTPIWLDAPDKAKMVHDDKGEEQQDWTTPEEVADVMLKVCTEDEIAGPEGEKVPIKGGSLIEVSHEAVRDVPLYGGTPPGVGTPGKGLTMASVGQAWVSMNGAIDQPGWGKF